MRSVALQAQHSFARTHYPSMSDDNYIKGMRQLSDGKYCIFGQSKDNYIALLDEYGNILWQHIYNAKSQGDMLLDMVELEDGRIMVGGLAQGQPQDGNARVSFFSKEGIILFDSIYPIYFGAGGCIQLMINNPERGNVVSVGQGNVGASLPLYFQKTDYNGKRIGYRFVYGTEKTNPLAFFRHKHKDGYIVFNGTSVADLDSTGELRKPMSSAYNSGPNQRGWYLLDVKQRKDGSYVSLSDNQVKFGWRLQFHDTTGAFIGDTLIFPNSQDTMGFGKFVLMQDGGYTLVGTHIYRLDSNFKPLWCTRLSKNAVEDKDVREATDGSVYGCSLEIKLKDSINGPYGMFVYKALADGRIITGLKEQRKKETFSVFPNPSNDGIFTLSGVPKGAQLQLTDMLGRTYPLIYDEVSGELDASALVEGVYYLQVRTIHGTAVHKISIGY